VGARTDGLSRPLAIDVSSAHRQIRTFRKPNHSRRRRRRWLMRNGVPQGDGRAGRAQGDRPPGSAAGIRCSQPNVRQTEHLLCGAPSWPFTDAACIVMDASPQCPSPGAAAGKGRDPAPFWAK
jgi:hypothetical protein